MCGYICIQFKKKEEEKRAERKRGLPRRRLQGLHVQCGEHSQDENICMDWKGNFSLGIYTYLVTIPKQQYII